MIVIFYGTSAELIKLLGLVKSVDRSQLMLICTAQQKHQIEQFHKQSKISPDMYLAKGWMNRDVHSIVEMFGFMIKVHYNFLKKYLEIRKMISISNEKYGTKTISVVHGDTLTTVVGAYFGRLLGLQVAHIEAGLRSGKTFHPFPEEIDRRIVSRIAKVHFAPNEIAVNNLKNENIKGAYIDTVYNTAKDAIEVASIYKSKTISGLGLPNKYGLVSIHRTELLERKKELKEFLESMGKYASSKNKLVFVDHATTREKIKTLGYEKYFNDSIIRIPKLAYMDFIQVVKGASYVVTDSGGLQEDVFFLGIPTIIHRITTERSEGLGVNVELSGLDISKVEDFLHSQKKQMSKKVIGDNISPSQIIIDYFLKNSYIVG